MGSGEHDTLGTRVRTKILRFGLPVVAAAALALGAIGGQDAVASATCAVVGDVGVVVPTGPGDVVISRDAGGSFSAIRVNGANCGTLATTAKMVVQPTADNVNVVIDQTNGRFEPGLGMDTGTAEIEFEVDGGTGTDTLKVIGTAAGDPLAFGSNGVALNDDTDVDVTIANLDGFIADTRGGNDAVTGAGNTNGTTGASTLPIRFFGGAGDDSLTGGAGVDTVDYSNLANGATVNLKLGTATGDGSDTLAGVENVNATSFNDTVTLKPDVQNFVTLNGGDDACKQLSRGVNDGGTENDTCDGGTGSDTYDASGILRNSPGVTIDFIADKVTGSPEDFIPNIEGAIGTAGEDVAKFQPNEINVVEMGAGDDVCYQSSVPDANSPTGNTPGVEKDVCDGGPGSDTYDATGIVRNSPGVIVDMVLDKVVGSGPDEIPGVEHFNGTNGEDEIRFAPGEINVANMGNGHDVCHQQSKPDPSSPTGNTSGVEGDTCNGGPGNDTYDASDVVRNSPGVTIDFIADKVAGSGPDLIPGVENAVATNGEDTVIDSDEDCNKVSTGGEDDTWIAGVKRPGSEPDGNGGLCGDDVDLGEGGEVIGDTIDYGKTEANSPGVIMNLPLGKVTGSPEDLTKDAENAFGSEFDDIIIGTPENNILKGRGGNDVISGGGGNDDIDGGDGQDTLTSSGPDDGVTCDANGNPSSTGDDVTLVEGCQAGSGDDVIYGTDGDDVIHGGAGNDTIYGLNGNDTIFGEDGNDIIDGGNGSDTMYGGAGNDVIRGGSNGDDQLYGEDGDDQLFGDNGNDIADGGPGNDTVDGGHGHDACVAETRKRCES